MLFQRFQAAIDRFLSHALHLSSSSSIPGTYGAHRDSDFYGMIGPRYVIFREGKHIAIGGMFQVRHRYDSSGRLLSRQLRFKAELQEGDALLFSFSKGISGVAIEGKEFLEFGYMEIG